MLSGLSSCVSALAFSRDGRMLAWSGRGDGLVSLHDATTGAQAIRLVGHGGARAGNCLRARREEPCHRRRRPNDQALGLCSSLPDLPAVDGLLISPLLRVRPRELEMKRNHQFATAVVFIVLGPMVGIGSGRGRCAERPVAAQSGRGPRAPPPRTPGRSPRRSTACSPPDGPRQRCSRAPPADDAEYLRRVYLDLVGNIPTAAQARDFLDDSSPDKRSRLVEELLDSSAYLTHATEVYRALLLPEADTDGQIGAITPTFEAWLRKKIVDEAGYDQIVREVLTVRLGSSGRRGGIAQDPHAEPSPLAYYVAKDAKPENLAAGTARTFLGIRLECAQCHNHPFDRWKREQFWGLAAFFAGVSKPGKDNAHGAIREIADRRELAIPETTQIVKAAFLDNKQPEWQRRPAGARFWRAG